MDTHTGCSQVETGSSVVYSSIISQNGPNGFHQPKPTVPCVLFSDIYILYIIIYRRTRALVQVQCNKKIPVLYPSQTGRTIAKVILNLLLLLFYKNVLIVVRCFHILYSMCVYCFTVSISSTIFTNNNIEGWKEGR